MEEIKFLPIGSIVVLKGGIQKLMIVSRAINVKTAEGDKYFDYGGCIYPIGLINDKVAYFKKEDIFKVVFEGYSDADNELMVENINISIKEKNNMEK